MKNANCGPAMLAAGIEARSWNGCTIQRRQVDGFVNATAMCKAGGKRWTLYSANDRTKQYVCALATSLGIQIPCAAAEVGFPTSGIPGLIHVIKGGSPELQGTWVHPRLAVDLARWISPAFAVWMDGWFLESIGAISQPAPQPAPQAKPRRRAPAPAPAQAALMTDEELWQTSHNVVALLHQRAKGDPSANDLLRAFAQHLLLSCEPMPAASQVVGAMTDWGIALSRRFEPRF